MDKIIFKILIIIGVFFAALFTVQQIDWMAIFNIEDNISSTEEKIGEVFWEYFHKNNKEVDLEEVKLPVDSLFSAICEANNINSDEITLHIIDSKEVNAFALPNKHLIINTALLLEVKNEAELSGVIGHELAHIQSDHVMKKLVKEMGLAVLISMTTGNGNTQVIIESLKTLTSSAYDRSLEEEADLKSVNYLIKADIDPTAFADFLYSLSGSNAELEEYLSWVSTHPYPKERAETIINYCEELQYKKEQVLDSATWNKLIKSVEEL